MRIVALLACFGVFASVCIVSAAKGAEYDKEFDELRIEARTLLRVLMRPKDLTPCSIERTWNMYPVPENFARKYLGSTLHADLIGSVGGNVDEIADPAHEHSNAFCTSEAREIGWASQRAGFEVSKTAHVDLHVYKVTFPVFSNHYTDAALVLISENQRFSRLGEKVVGPTLFSSIYALAFHRIGGQWVQVGEEELAIAE